VKSKIKPYKCKYQEDIIHPKRPVLRPRKFQKEPQTEEDEGKNCNGPLGADRLLNIARLVNGPGGHCDENNLDLNITQGWWSRDGTRSGGLLLGRTGREAKSKDRLSPHWQAGMS